MSKEADHHPQANMTTFILVWFGQAISLIGSGITAFAISLWIYSETSSVTLFSLNAFLNFLPGIVLSPMAGVWADRWSRRRIMLLADGGAAASTLFVAVMLFSGQLAIGHVYFATAANALFSTFQKPAYAAAVTTLVPKKHFTRAEAMIQLGTQFGGVIAPMLAGFLIVWLGLPGIFVIDFATFLIAESILLLRRFPELAKRPVEKKIMRPSLRQEVLEGWRYIAQHPGLRGLMILSSVNLFLIAVNAAFSIPVILTITSPETVGLMAMIFGTAGVMSSAVITAWGGPRRRIIGVFGANVVIGIGLIFFALRPNLPLIILGGIGISLALPLRDSTTGAIWRSQVPVEIQGRVFALLQMTGATAFGLVYLLLGPLADVIFEPLMAADSLLAGSVGRIIGVGDGRGMALCVIVAGILTLVMTLMAVLNPHVRRVDDETPATTGQTS
jgi:MFS transporter, DHA3 family, macrolide efflux protein